MKMEIKNFGRFGVEPVYALKLGLRRLRGLFMVMASAMICVSMTVLLLVRHTAAHEQRAIDIAVGETLAQLLADPQMPKDAQRLQELTTVMFGILHPDLAHSEYRKDPRFIEAEAAAIATFYNPDSDAKRIEDPESLRRYRAAMEAFAEGGGSDRPSFVPARVTREQIQTLRDNPEFRRQREEPIRALLRETDTAETTGQ